MNIRSFQDLQVWQKGHSLVLIIYKKTKYFPDEERFGLVNQVRRSAASICANIAEGGKKSTKEFSRFLEIADGSLEETKYHLILSRDLGYIDSQSYSQLASLCDEIGRMLNALIKSLRPK